MRTPPLTLTSGLWRIGAMSAHVKKSPVKGKRRPPLNGFAALRGAVRPAHQDAVRSFCERHALFAQVSLAARLAKRFFKTRKLDLQVEHDPERSGEWVVLHVDSDASVDATLEAYHSFKKKWLSLVMAPDQRELIRLVYSIA